VGEAKAVVSIRRKFQTTMRDDLVAGIETLTNRKVLSFMSDHDADHDYAAEVFVLDGPPSGMPRSDGDGDGDGAAGGLIRGAPVGVTAEGGSGRGPADCAASRRG
jgi:hypothetical protein